MQTPLTKQELHPFLGMIDYLSQFIPSMSNLTSNLRKLLKKDVLFQWTDSHEKEFQELKSKVSSDACLHYFDTLKPVTLQVDISKVGQGAVLMQKDSQGRDWPVVFAPKSLTPAETRYANIEHEVLVVVFWLHDVSSLHLQQSIHKPEWPQASWGHTPEAS